ncbi:MAG: hypothetical protein RR614_02350 [Eubacterium sp.]
MKKQLTIQIADPAGNITVFVLDPVPQKDYHHIANQLLQMKALEAEQVGFVALPQNGGEARMEMMGGEFCGNATRSFGYLFSLRDPEKPETVGIEVSGAEGVLAVEIDHQKGTCATAMPLPLEIKALATGQNEVWDCVVFDGIVHLIITAPPKEEKETEEILDVLKKTFDCEACGIIFLEEKTITPVVYVRETDSTIWESSCGSGSMACGVWYTQNKPDGIYDMQFKQPSSGFISVSVKIKQQKIIQCKMGGPVKVSEPRSVEIEL